MKVKYLMKILKGLNPEADVCLNDVVGDSIMEVGTGNRGYVVYLKGQKNVNTEELILNKVLSAKRKKLDFNILYRDMYDHGITIYEVESAVEYMKTKGYHFDNLVDDYVNYYKEHIVDARSLTIEDISLFCKQRDARCNGCGYEVYCREIDCLNGEMKPADLSDMMEKEIRIYDK